MADRDLPVLEVRGLNVYYGKVTHAAVAHGVGTEYVPPEEALAS